MVNKILILYSSSNGHTLKIAKKIALTMQNQYNIVEICNLNLLDEVNQEYLKEFNAIIIGASIRYGKFKKNVYELINKNRSILDDKYTAFFGVNLLARKAHKSSTDTNPYMINFFKDTQWKPDIAEVFAGALKYQEYNLFEKFMLLFIMYLTKGPLNTKKQHVFTQWKKVEDFSLKIKEKQYESDQKNPYFT